MLRVAFNLANSFFRRKFAERRANLRAGNSSTAIHHDPDSALAMAVKSELVRLPQRQRRAIILRYYADLSVREIAQVMECPREPLRR